MCSCDWVPASRTQGILCLSGKEYIYSAILSFGPAGKGSGAILEVGVIKLKADKKLPAVSSVHVRIQMIIALNNNDLSLRFGSTSSR